MTPIGKRRHRVTVQTPTITKNAMNEDIKTYSDVKSMWAEYTDLKGDEYFQAMKFNPEITGKINIRYYSELKNDMQFKFGENRILEIMYFFSPDNRNIETHVWVKERVVHG